MTRALNFLTSIAVRSLGVLLVLLGVWLWFISSDRVFRDGFGRLAGYGVACLAWIAGGLGVTIASGQKLSQPRD